MKTSRLAAFLFAMGPLIFQAPPFLPNAQAAVTQAPASQPKKKNKTKNKRNRKKLILKGHHSKHSRRPA